MGGSGGVWHGILFLSCFGGNGAGACAFPNITPAEARPITANSPMLPQFITLGPFVQLMRFARPVPAAFQLPRTLPTALVASALISF
jgi:hypothetical protein